MGHRVIAFVGHTLQCGHGSQMYGQSKDTPLIRMMRLLLPWLEVLRENTIRFEPHVHSASSALQTSSAHALRLSCAISAQVEIQVFPWRPRWNTCLHTQCIAQIIGLPHHRFAFAAKPSPTAKRRQHTSSASGAIDTKLVLTFLCLPSPSFSPLPVSEVPDTVSTSLG